MKDRIRSLLGTAGGLALLPLSAVPLLLIGPALLHSHTRFQRAYGSGPYPAPAVLVTPRMATRWMPPAPYRGAIPVLAYHGIDDANDGYSVSREEFARQMEMLDRSGFRTITIGQYVRFRAGDGRGLPSRPILITFDDGRLDSYRGADAVLEQHHMSAVMYVITAPVKAGNPFHLSWRELHRMQRSGRWDIQPHAHDGHRRIVVDPAGDTEPFYAARRYTRTDGVESFAAYTQRVATDIYDVKDDFKDQGLNADTFAVPFGDHGQHANDPRVPAFVDGLLATQFAVAFIQSPGNDPRYTRPTGPAYRYELHSATTTDELRQWLVRHDPGEKAA